MCELELSADGQATVQDIVNEFLIRLEEKFQQFLVQPRQEWFSVKQAATLTGLSPDHVRRAVTGGTLPCSNVGTHDRPTYRISRKDIEEWMERRKAGALPPPRRKKKVTETCLPVSPHLRTSRQPF